MATAYKVFFNREIAGPNAVPGGTSEPLSKAETETGPHSHRKYGTEGIKFTAPLEQCELIEVTAESEVAAVTAVQHILGCPAAEGELSICTAANFKKASGA